MHLRGISVGGSVLFAATLLPGALLSPPAAAFMQPVSQARSLDAQASAQDDFDNQTDGDTASAPDFSPFDTTVSASASVPSGSADASASQTSEVGATRVTGHGEVTISAFGGGPGFSADSSGVSGFGFRHASADDSLSPQAPERFSPRDVRHGGGATARARPTRKVRSDPDEGGLGPATPVSAAGAHRLLRVLTLDGPTEAAAEAVARLL